MYHIIINPHSSSGRGLSIWKETEKLLKERGVSYCRYITNREGDAKKYARKLTSGKKSITLIIVGGDGTVNEALNGIADPSLVTLGYIPAGSSNDLARDLSLPTDAKKALTIILDAPQTILMDLGEISYLEDGKLKKRTFAVSSGIGFDAGVCHEALHSRMKHLLNRLHLGKLTYLGIALKQLMKAPKAGCTISFDGDPPIRIERFLFVAAMIHRFEGGGFKFCPDADCSDGMVNTCIVGDINKLKIPFILPTGFTGSHLRFRGIEARCSRSVRIAADVPLPVHCDGESCGFQSEILVTCKKEQIHMIV